ncbi:MAG: ABC transporter permease [Rectinemataceae bacterium]
MKRFNKYTLYEISAPLIGFVASMLILLVIVIIVGENPGSATDAIWKMTFASSTRTATILSTAVPEFLAGLSAAFAFRANIFNIGVEGQYFVGGLVGALAGIYVPLPTWLHLPFVVIAAMVGGALWAAVPAALKVSRGIHEVITTIMFNNIALALVNYLVNGPLTGIGVGGSLEPQTKHILPTALFGNISGLFRAVGWDVPNSVYLDYSLPVAVLAGVVVWFILFRLRIGFDVRAIGTSTDVALYAGINVGRVQLWAFLFSGALAGLIGLQEIFAVRGYYTFQIASGLGFDGIAIALIGRNSPIGVVFAALLFAFLRQAGYGLQFFTRVPNSVISVIMGLMILIIVVTSELVSRYIKALRKKEAM